MMPTNAKSTTDSAVERWTVASLVAGAAAFAAVAALLAGTGVTPSARADATTLPAVFTDNFGAFRRERTAADEIKWPTSLDPDYADHAPIRDQARRVGGGNLKGTHWLIPQTNEWLCELYTSDAVGRKPLGASCSKASDLAKFGSVSVSKLGRRGAALTGIVTDGVQKVTVRFKGCKLAPKRLQVVDNGFGYRSKHSLRSVSWVQNGERMVYSLGPRPKR